MRTAAQWTSFIIAAASPVITSAQTENAPCNSCSNQEQVAVQSGKNCELQTLDEGIVTVASMLRTAFLCGNEPEICRGFFTEVIGGASWNISWCPMFEDGVALRFDPAPTNPVRSSFLIWGTVPTPDAILREDPEDHSTDEAISDVLAKTAGELEAYLRRARRSP